MDDGKSKITRPVYTPESVICLLLTQSFIIMIKESVTRYLDESGKLGTIIVTFVLLVLYVLFAWKRRLQWLTIDEYGISVRSPLFKINKTTWEEIDSVQLVPYGYVFKRTMLLIKKRPEATKDNENGVPTPKNTYQNNCSRRLFMLIPSTGAILERVLARYKTPIGNYDE